MKDEDLIALIELCFEQGMTRFGQIGHEIRLELGGADLFTSVDMTEYGLSLMCKKNDLKAAEILKRWIEVKLPHRQNKHFLALANSAIRKHQTKER